MSNVTVINTASGIAQYRLLTLRSALKLETLGMKNSHGSVAPIIRKEMGSKTKNKKALLSELDYYISGQDRAEG